MRSYQNAITQKNRIPFAAGVFVLVALSIVGRLFYLQIVRHDYFLKVASSQHWVKNTIPAKRGKIYAMDTLSNTPYVVATNETLDMVYVNPEQLKDKDNAAQSLSEILSMDKKEILDKFGTSRLYVPIKHKLNKDQSDKIRNLKIDGIVLSAENWRTYPESTLAANILGFVNGDGQGNYGLEQSYNEQLTGVPGQLKEETDNSGIKIAFGDNVLSPAKDGDDLYLTIDRYIQGEAEKQLNTTVKKFAAAGGSVIVMDPKTGAILAMAENPTFDPNKYTEVKDYGLFKNPAVNDLYEPGSIFKVITMAAGLDAGKIKPDTTYEDTGKVLLDGFNIMNSDKKAHGTCTMTYVLEQSLNTGTTFVQQKLGKDAFYDYLKKFGLGKKTGIELPGEAGGKVYAPNEINDHGYATMSFGQSISTTPIQMIRSFAAVANKGKMMKPFLVQEIKYNNGKKETKKPQEDGQIISEQAARDLTNMMVSVVEKGHGTQAKVKGYRVAGKTGTAQVVRDDGRGYQEGKNIGSFIGFAPADNPRFVVLAKIDEPHNVAWAESTAAPVVGAMLDYLLKYYQVPPTEKM